jgi:polyisoprenoid-binding protein YceI
MPAFDTPEPIIAEIDVYTGQVRIQASARADTVVEVRPTDPSTEASVQAAERTIVEFSGGRLLVKGPKPSVLGHLRNWRGAIDVTVELPAGSRVEAEVAAEFIAAGPLGRTVLRSSLGDVRMEETGPLEARASIGDISVDRVNGPAEATTSTGSIRIGRIAGPGNVKASTGGITVGEVTGELQLKTGTGDITVDRVLGDLTAKSAHGRIRIGAAVSGTVHVEGGHGKVGIGIAEGTAAWLDLHSKNGVVRNALTAADGPETADAVVEVRVQTNWGDVDVHRS